jgi:Ca2+-binding RTX toxin-like protein
MGPAAEPRQESKYSIGKKESGRMTKIFFCKRTGMRLICATALVGTVGLGGTIASGSAASAADITTTFVVRDNDGETKPGGQLYIHVNVPGGSEVLYAADANGILTISTPIGTDVLVRQTSPYWGQPFPAFTVTGPTTRTYVDRLGDAIFPTIIGTAGDDTIIGTPGRDVVLALGGDDTIDGLGGDDLIIGGAGDDILYGRGGDDRIFGGTGDDTTFGNGSSDTIDGGDGDDALNGGAGDDTLYGWLGSDVVKGGAGNDSLWENVPAGNTDAYDPAAFNLLYGGPGNDQVYMPRTNGRVFGDAGADHLVVDGLSVSNDVRVNCGAGADVLNWSNGAGPAFTQCESASEVA